MAGQHVVILGGGFGGAAAARTLRHLLAPEHTVTLVDRERRTYLCGALPWLIVGERKPIKISRALGSLVRRGVNYVQAEVQAIDLANQRVQISRGPLAYDYLVVALGAEYGWGTIPGLDRAHSFYSLDTARKLRDALRRFRKGRIVITASRLPYKCPPAPYEAAFILDWVFTQRGVRQAVDLHVVTPEPTPLRILGPQQCSTLRSWLGQRGITLHADQTLKDVDPDGRRATFASGESISYDLLAVVPPHRSPGVVQQAGLTDNTGWVPVHPRTLATRHPNVYAIGDVTFLPLATGAPLPKAGVFANAEGDAVARTIAAAIQGEEPTQFPGDGYCFLEYGQGKGAVVTGGFLADPAPQVTLLPPSLSGHQRKLRFEQDWRRFRI